ncbi:MAG: DUF1538 domain-containing protein [Schleiferiaceae bacterium]|nr:DUF1538 domain-containing protein [Schleiferiaceae bacterium]
MIRLLGQILLKLKASFMDLLPILVVVGFFQIFVLKVPFPNLSDILLGVVFVVVGLMLFVEGLEIGLFPIGENLSYALAKKGSLFWLLTFSFLLGFSTTVAEPALIAITKEAAKIAVEEGFLGAADSGAYANGLRLIVAFAVGSAILVGIIRIIKGWPIYYLVLPLYGMVILLSFLAPPQILGLAFDLGGVTTSTVTVPLVTALGVGLASVIDGRSPLVDGFGLIAFASLFPMIFVMIYGMMLF